MNKGLYVFKRCRLYLNFPFHKMLGAMMVVSARWINADAACINERIMLFVKISYLLKILGAYAAHEIYFGARIKERAKRSNGALGHSTPSAIGTSIGLYGVTQY